MVKILMIAIAALMTAFPAAAQNQSAVQTGVSFADLVEKLLPGVVNISTVREQPSEVEKIDVVSGNEYLRDYFLQDEGGRTSLGSGFLIDSKGYIVTNNHVIDKADEIVVRLADDRQFNAVVVGRDRMTDLALLKIEAAEPFSYVEFGDSDKVRVGDWILAIGNPFGLGGSVSAGIVSAKSRDIDAGSYDSFIQTDAAINQGSSGGPLFNMQGKVIGVNTAIFSSSGASMGIGFATPVNLSKFVIEQLMAKGKVERGWIGVKVVSNDVALDISATKTFTGGVTVNSLSENSPAVAAGIEAGDIIMALNGTDIRNAKDFSRRIAETPVGTTIILRLWRNGQIKDISLDIVLMPEEKKSAPVHSEQPGGYIEQLGLMTDVRDNAVVVDGVTAGSDAEAKGIKPGDIITEADGRSVSSAGDLRSYAAYAEANDGTMELTVISDGIPQKLLLEK